MPKKKPVTTTRNYRGTCPMCQSRCYEIPNPYALRMGLHEAWVQCENPACGRKKKLKPDKR